MDALSISGITAYGFHGVAPEEKVLGQQFLVDVELGMDLGVAGRSDELADTVNYVSVVERVRELVGGPSLNLIEAVAERIAEGLLTCPVIKSVTVQLSKPHIPAPQFGGRVTVRICRQRKGV